MSGKGSTPRPVSVDADTYAANYARTFSRQLDEVTGYDPRHHHGPPDRVEALRRKHLAEADRAINGVPCTDWPSRDALPTHDPETPDAED